MLSEDEVRGMIATIWDTVLDLPATPVTRESLPSDEGALHLVGCIHITGGFHGAVTVRYTDRLAREASSRLFDVPPEEASREEVHDTLSELTNMAGGNVKAAVAERIGATCQLSLPSVTEGRDFVISLPHTERVLEVCFTCLGEPLRVEILRESCDARRSTRTIRRETHAAP